VASVSAAGGTVVTVADPVCPDPGELAV